MEAKTNLNGQHDDQQYSARFLIPDSEAKTTEPKMIRIIDGRYNEKFQVQDGGYISVDGIPYQLHYFDETHFQIAGGSY